jgi:endonuclease III
VLLYGFGKYVIPVDVHVHRLANLFGWVKTKKPEETKVALERKIKGKERAAVNCALVSLGQETGYSAEKMNEILGKHLTKAAYSKLKPGQPANRKKKDGRLPIEALGESMR